VLAAQVQELPTRGDDLHSGTAGEEVGDKGCGFKDMLEGVEDQEATLSPDALDNGIHEGFSGACDPQRADDHRKDRGHVTCGKGHEEQAVGEIGLSHDRRVHSEPRLPDAAWTSQCDEPSGRVFERAYEHDQFALASDEPRDLRWQPRASGPGFGFSRPQAIPARASAPPCDGKELPHLLVGQPQRLCQPGSRIPVDRGTQASLDIADGPTANAGPFSQLLLGEAD
jgi:hypothetical protein